MGPGFLIAQSEHQSGCGILVVSTAWKGSREAEKSICGCFAGLRVLVFPKGPSARRTMHTKVEYSGVACSGGFG